MMHGQKNIKLAIGMFHVLCWLAASSQPT